MIPKTVSTTTGGTLLESRFKMDAKSACVKGGAKSSAQRKSALTIDLSKYLFFGQKLKHQQNLGKGTSTYVSQVYGK